MKFTLTAAIRYLEKFNLNQDEVLKIDLWGNEGYDLQQLARHYEGRLHLKDDGDFLSSGDNPCKNSQLNCLMAEIGKADLGLQFIDTYPAVQRGDDEINLRVLIAHPETLQNALSRLEPSEPPHGTRSGARKPLLNGFKRRPVNRKTLVKA